MSDNLKWGRERCRREYVQAEDEIGLRAIAEMAGRPQSSIFRWSAIDNWPEQRKQYWSNVRNDTDQKTIDKISDRLSETYSEIAERHYKSYRVYTELAVLYGRIKIEEIKKVREEGDREKIATLFNENNSRIANNWSLVLDRSLKGEAASIGLPFAVNPNAAIEQAEKIGYIPVQLPEGMSKDDLQEYLDGFEPISE